VRELRPGEPLPASQTARSARVELRLKAGKQASRRCKSQLATSHERKSTEQIVAITQSQTYAELPWVRVALEQIAAKQIEAIELSFLKSSTPADKYATLIWISGPFDEPLELSNGVIKTDRFDS